jgi:hypothetical protein
MEMNMTTSRRSIHSHLSASLSLSLSVSLSISFLTSLSVPTSLTVPLLAQDVRQMWTNCQLYNPPRSPIYLSSKRFASPPLSSSVPPLLSSCHRLGEYFESLYSQFLKKVSSHSVHTAQESD